MGKEKCTMEVYQVEGLDGAIPPSFAQNRRISILNNQTSETENSQLTTLIVSGKKINQIILPYSHDTSDFLASVDQSREEQKAIQVKPLHITSLRSVEVNQTLSFPSLPGNIHSLILNKGKREGFLTDEFGNLLIFNISENFADSTSKHFIPSPHPAISSFSQPSPLPNSSKLGVISEYGKWMYIGDWNTGEIVRQYFTIQPPTSILPLSSNTLALSEFNQVSIWDDRSAKGCVQRLVASESWIYAMANEGELMCAGGASRSVQSIDTRRWQMIERWQNCLKYEITDLLFSKADPTLLFVSGLDAEIVCEKWNGKKSQSNHTKSFRGDSCWLGFDQLDDIDLMAGFNTNGRVYVFNRPSAIHPSDPSL